MAYHADCFPLLWIRSADPGQVSGLGQSTEVRMRCTSSARRPYFETLTDLDLSQVQQGCSHSVHRSCQRDPTHGIPFQKLLHEQRMPCTLVPIFNFPHFLNCSYYPLPLPGLGMHYMKRSMIAVTWLSHVRYMYSPCLVLD